MNKHISIYGKFYIFYLYLVWFSRGTQHISYINLIFIIFLCIDKRNALIDFYRTAFFCSIFYDETSGFAADLIMMLGGCFKNGY